MPVVQTQQTINTSAPSSHNDRTLLLSITVVFALFHILTNGRYGFHRDELQFLSDARHLDWGFVAYPPFTPFVERIAMAIFGLSLIGLRLFSVIAQAIVIYVSGLMARDLGGNRWAQAATALSVALSGLPLFEATEFQYTSFGMLWWVLICFFTIRLLKSENPRWWLAIGAAAGLGLMTKYSIVFFLVGLLGGMLLTRERRYFGTKWFWGGVAIACLIFLPNIIWLIRHDFISYHFLQRIHARDVGEGRAAGFFKYQFLFDANPFATPVWIAGLVAFILERRYRLLFWMYAIPVAMFWLGKGRFYYVAEAYPILIAMGAVVAERWLSRKSNWFRHSVKVVYVAGVVAVGAYGCCRLVPLASNGPLRDFALRNNGDLREEFGWNELVKTVAGIRNSLPPDQQAHLGITTANYGEYGAIEILGRADGLPQPIGTTNSEWLRGYPTSAPTTLIVLGLGEKEANAIFTGCRLAGHNGNSLGVSNEESRDHPNIFVCGPPREPWPVLWQHHKDFG
jgi:hypothetical protein